MWYGLSALAFLASFRIALSIGPERVVCYFHNWAVYTPGDGKFQIEDINPHLCTHAIYGFVGINSGDGSIRITDHFQDIDLKGYERFNNLTKINPKLKTLITIGGWVEGSKGFSQVAASPTLRTAFVNNAVKFVKDYGFDGFDIDWEYPADASGSPNDKQNFATLLREFRQVFDQHGLLLTAAVGVSSSRIETSYDVPALSRYLDFINVMTYDFHGAWEKVTGINAPLYPALHEITPAQRELNVAASINAWIRKGARPDKLVLGIGTYGRTFTLDNPSKNGINAPASQPGQPGPYTREAGMLAYYEICDFIKNQQWKVEWNVQQQVPYAYYGNQWVGYDNPLSVAIKMQFVKLNFLGGAMIWSLETDDFRGTCGNKYPLLTTINANL